MSGVSSDSEDFSLTCSVSSVESKELELSETEGGLEMIELYQFEPVASDSAESDAGAEDDSGDEERLANTDW